ncbi:MAG: phospholipase D-like domain-containing protein [Baekduia sp.]
MTKPFTPARTGTLVGAGLAEMADACRRARRTVDIATPFLSADVAAYLVRACDEGSARDRRLITALNAAAVEGGYLDPDGIEELIEAGFEAKSLRNLHAKVLLADGNWGLIGSGNLTVAGSNGGNAELGIVLGPTQAKAARRAHFDSWWDAAEPLDVKWLRTLNRHKPSNLGRRRREGRGGVWPSRANVDLGGFSTNNATADTG